MRKEKMGLLQLFAEEAAPAVRETQAPEVREVQAPEQPAQTGDEALDRIEAHFMDLQRQAEAMREVFPGFDLGRALDDPLFARMTAPDVGISVEDAWYALHRTEIQSAAMQVAAQKTAQMLSDSVRSGRLRPSENGTRPQGAGVAAFDYRAASPQQRAALKKRIREAAARGEKLYPGM